MASKGLTIAVDFDGTCVEHEYPHTGNDAEGAVEVFASWSATTAA